MGMNLIGMHLVGVYIVGGHLMDKFPDLEATAR